MFTWQNQLHFLKMKGKMQSILESFTYQLRMYTIYNDQ